MAKRLRGSYGLACLRGAERILASRFFCKAALPGIQRRVCMISFNRFAAAGYPGHHGKESRVSHRVARSCAWRAPRARRRGKLSHCSSSLSGAVLLFNQAGPPLNSTAGSGRIGSSNKLNLTMSSDVETVKTMAKMAPALSKEAIGCGASPRKKISTRTTNSM
jgi:hypothetical protein